MKHYKIEIRINMQETRLNCHAAHYFDLIGQKCNSFIDYLILFCINLAFKKLIKFKFI